MEEYSELTEILSAAESENINSLSDVFSSVSKVPIIVGALFLLLFFFLMVKYVKKEKAKTSQSMTKEINAYLSGFGGESFDSYKYSGILSFSGDSIMYTRGQRTAVFPVYISKETDLAECLVEPWFENRNYNGREAQILLRDIEHYLLAEKICKKVNIISDEEYEEKYSYEDTENEENYYKENF